MVVRILWYVKHKMGWVDVSGFKARLLGVVDILQYLNLAT
jgi:hypothetical protein